MKNIIIIFIVLAIAAILLSPEENGSEQNVSIINKFVKPTENGEKSESLIRDFFRKNSSTTNGKYQNVQKGVYMTKPHFHKTAETITYKVIYTKDAVNSINIFNEVKNKYNIRGELGKIEYEMLIDCRKRTISTNNLRIFDKYYTVKKYVKGETSSKEYFVDKGQPDLCEKYN